MKISLMETTVQKMVAGIVLSFFVVVSSWAVEINEEEFGSPSGTYGNEDSALPSGVTLGQPTLNGSGCPANSVDTLLSGDAKTLSILYSQFGALAGGNAPHRVQKNCTLAIPFHVPAGMSVAVTRMDYRGYVWAENSSSRVEIHTEYFLTGVKHNDKPTKLGKRKKKMFGPLDEDYHLSSLVKNNKKSWSACGQDLIFNVKTTLLAHSGDRLEVEGLIDSVDMSQKNPDMGKKHHMAYHLSWKDCSGSGGGKGKGKGKGHGKGRK